MTSELRLPKAADLVAANLRRRIVRNEIEAGAPLPPEATLMTQFGVSRPTLREAFRVLESEGLIVVKRGARGGARVRQPDEETAARYLGHVVQVRGASLADVYDARVVIESVAAGMVAASHTDADLVRLDEAVAHETEVLSGDISTLVELEHRFHLLVMEITGNQTLYLFSQTLNQLVEAAGLHRSLTDVDAAGHSPQPKRAAKAHARLVELIREGDAAAAEALWNAHLRAAKDFVLSTSRPDAPFEIIH